MRRVLPLAVFALLLTPAPLAATDLPGWLAGTWSRQAGATWAEELWTAPRGGLMLGVARNGFGPDVTDWDYLRIERGRDGQPELLAQAKGGVAVRFALAVASEAAIEFANPAHPWPQRIRYSREGQLLVLEMSLMDGSRAEAWNYRPVATTPD